MNWMAPFVVIPLVLVLQTLPLIPFSKSHRYPLENDCLHQPHYLHSHSWRLSPNLVNTRLFLRCRFVKTLRMMHHHPRIRTLISQFILFLISFILVSSFWNFVSQMQSLIHSLSSFFPFIEQHVHCIFTVYANGPWRFILEGLNLVSRNLPEHCYYSSPFFFLILYIYCSLVLIQSRKLTLVDLLNLYLYVCYFVQRQL